MIMKLSCPPPHPTVGSIGGGGRIPDYIKQALFALFYAEIERFLKYISLTCSFGPLGFGKKIGGVFEFVKKYLLLE